MHSRFARIFISSNVKYVSVLGKQFIGNDRKIADAFPRRMINSICDCSAGSGNADFTDAVCAQRIQFRVWNIDCRHIDFANVRVDRHMVFGEIGVGDSTSTWVDVGIFMQR